MKARMTASSKPALVSLTTSLRPAENRALCFALAASEGLGMAGRETVFAGFTGSSSAAAAGSTAQLRPANKPLERMSDLQFVFMADSIWLAQTSMRSGLLPVLRK
jgi:hypothetical protein